MEEARGAAFEKGKTEGAQIAKDSIEQRTEILVQSIAGNISTLERGEQARRDQYVQDALIIAYKTLQTLVPSLSNTLATEDINRFLKDFFKSTATQSGFQLTIHPDMEEAITPRAAVIHSDLKIVTDPKLAPTAATITWSEGHATWKPQAINDKILELIKTHISDPKSLEAELLDESTKKTHNNE